MWAHPRSRGENSTTPGRCLADTGSSPLTRGKRGHRSVTSRSLGLIPAHAGKTRRRRRRARTLRAHPRSRGENEMDLTTVTRRQGSSPLTRGKQGCNKTCNKTRGLIPAHAGKTGARRDHHRVARAHPRSRGENWTVAAGSGSGQGSSPLTRGKRERAAHPSCHVGLIPAHAGKTAA